MAAIEKELFETASTTRSTMRQAEKTLASFEGVFEENSAVRYTLENFLTELTYAARSLRSLVEMLERDPAVIIRGKGKHDPSGGK